MANTFRAKEFVSGDVYIREDLSRAYDADSLLVSIGAISDGDFPIVLAAGYPFFNATPVIAATLALANSFLVQAITFTLEDKTNTIPKEVAVFVRGTGIVVDKNSLPTVDYTAAAGAFDMAAYQLELEDLDFVVRDEPLTVSGPQTV